MKSNLVAAMSFALALAAACAAMPALDAQAGVRRTVPVEDVTVFCRMHGDLDHPGAAFFGAAYKPGLLPKQIEEEEASHWRCMNGRVLMCSDSADGDSCSKKDASRKPSRVIGQFCAENPSSHDVPRYAEAYSSSSWRCDGRKPAVVRSYSLDRRGFMRAMWIPYIVGHGGPVHPPDFPDPR